MEGKWYYLYHDPSIDDVYGTFPVYDQTLGSGKEKNEKIQLGFYGKLPSGDYRIVLGGQDGEIFNYVTAEMRK